MTVVSIPGPGSSVGLFCLLVWSSTIRAYSVDSFSAVSPPFTAKLPPLIPGLSLLIRRQLPLCSARFDQECHNESSLGVQCDRADGDGRGANALRCSNCSPDGAVCLLFVCYLSVA